MIFIVLHDRTPGIVDPIIAQAMSDFGGRGRHHKLKPPRQLFDAIGDIGTASTHKNANDSLEGASTVLRRLNFA